MGAATKDLGNTTETPCPCRRLGSALPEVIEEHDRTGGSAPSFIVEWIADGPVSDPIIHSVMIGTTSQQGISFLGEGVVPESR